MDILIILLVLIYLIIATISDIKTQEIPDSLNYSFISLGIFIYLIKTISTGNNIYLLSCLITLGAFLVIGNLMYYTKQWGGGDSKLLIGLGAILPIYPNLILENFEIKTLNYLGIDLLLNILLIGSIYAIIIAIYLCIKNRERFVEQFSKEYKKSKAKIRERISWILIIGINITGYILSESNNQRIFILIISLILLSLNYLIIAAKSIENVTMYATISTKNLREGDAITKELKYNDKILYTPTVHGVSKKQILEIQRYIEKVEIKSGIPFAPSFLIGTIITLIFGNILLYLLP